MDDLRREPTEAEREAVARWDAMDPWVRDLALLLAHRRTRGDVFMDGSHNPLPTEVRDAQRFVTGLRAAVSQERDMLAEALRERHQPVCAVCAHNKGEHPMKAWREDPRTGLEVEVRKAHEFKPLPIDDPSVTVYCSCRAWNCPIPQMLARLAAPAREEA